MRFAFCIFKYFPYGGIQRDGLRIAAELQRRGHEIRYYAREWEGERPDWLDYVRVPVAGLTRHGIYRAYERWVARDLAARPVDFVFGLNKMRGLDAYFAGDSCYAEKSRTQRNWLYRRLPRYRYFAATEAAVFGARRATRILNISPRQAALYQRHYATPADRFFELPPGIARDRVHDARSDDLGRRVRAELGIQTDERLLLFAGSGFRKKGLDRVLLGVAELRKTVSAETFAQTHLVVVGADKAEPFERMAVRLGVGERVRFLGGRDDLHALLFAADALLLPAYDENTGTVIVEALVAQLPAIVSADCGYAHYVSATGGGIVLEDPFAQRELDTILASIAGASLPLAEMAERGGTLAANDDIFAMPEVAAAELERFAAARGAGRVAFCLFKYFPYGGLQRDFLRIARAIGAAGFAVRVYVLHWEGDLPDGFDVVVVPRRGLLSHRSYRAYARWVRDHLRRRPVDLVVGFNKMPGLDLYFAADGCFEHKARALRGAWYSWLERYRFFASAERAVFGRGRDTRILLLTQTQREHFQLYYDTESERMELLPPGVGADRFADGDRGEHRPALLRELGVADDALLLLAIGSGFATKGLDRSIAALAALPEDLGRRALLLVVGADDEAPYRRQAARSGVQDRVRFLGGRADVPELLRASDVLLHPARVESGGVVLLEALIAGLPVIASSACGYAWHVESAGGGELLGEAFDTDGYASALERLLLSPQRRAEYGAAGRRYGASTQLTGLVERAVERIEALALERRQRRMGPAA
ncbi:MAG: glycosyltransferase family 4 protein [Pseudomonadota bacterium]